MSETALGFPHDLDGVPNYADSEAAIVLQTGTDTPHQLAGPLRMEIGRELKSAGAPLLTLRELEGDIDVQLAMFEGRLETHIIWRFRAARLSVLNAPGRYPYALVCEVGTDRPFVGHGRLTIIERPVA